MHTCILQFANNMDPMGGSNGELQDLTNRLVHRVMAYGLEVSIEKSKLMTNSKCDISADISVKGQKLEELTNFKYRGITPSKDGTCSEDIHNRTARLHKGCLSLLSSPSSSFSARHGPCLLTPRKGCRLSRPGYFSASPT